MAARTRSIGIYLTNAEKLVAFVEDLNSEVQRHFGDRLMGLLQFGSTVNQVKPETDLDLLVIVANLPTARADRYAEWNPVETHLQSKLARLATEGIRLELSPILKTPEEAQRFHSYYLDFPDCSRILYDPRGILAALVRRIAEYIKDSGAVRKWIGALWYWDLAPDATYRDERKVGW